MVVVVVVVVVVGLGFRVGGRGGMRERSGMEGSVVAGMIRGRRDLVAQSVPAV